MRKLTKKELTTILDKHKKWLNNEGGERADLRHADLRFADLSFADLSRADLSRADLSRADLSRADLRYADLKDANLSNADLRGADLSFADLSNADLRSTDLNRADLSYADLRFANTNGVNGIEIYSIDNVGTFKGKITFIPSLDQVFAGCWKGNAAEFKLKCEEVIAEHPRTKKGLKLAMSMVDTFKEESL